MSELLPAPTRTRVTASDIQIALRARLPGGEYALLWEVSNAAGFSRSRSADAIAMSLWPSRGLNIFGFEIKVSRGDWLRELKDPGKAEPIAQYCDFWIVCAPKGLIGPSELPATWGLWEVDGRGMAVTVPATKLDAVALNKSFLAAVLRRADEANAAIVRTLIDKERVGEREAMEKRITQSVEERTRRHQELADNVAAFEKASGVKMGRYSGGDIGKIFAMALAHHGDDYFFIQAKQLRDRLDELIKTREQDEPPKGPQCQQQ